MRALAAALITSRAAPATPSARTPAALTRLRAWPLGALDACYPASTAGAASRPAPRSTQLQSVLPPHTTVHLHAGVPAIMSATTSPIVITIPSIRRPRVRVARANCDARQELTGTGHAHPRAYPRGVHRVRQGVTGARDVSAPRPPGRFCAPSTCCCRSSGAWSCSQLQLQQQQLLLLLQLHPGFSRCAHTGTTGSALNTAVSRHAGRWAWLWLCGM